MRKTTILALAVIGLLSTAQPMSAMEIMPATLEAGLQRTILSNYDIDRISQRYPGAKVLWKGTITGFQDKGKIPEKDTFEGCDWDRRIFLDDQYQITCQGYGYHYAYRPEGLLLESKYGQRVLYVEGDFFDISLF